MIKFSVTSECHMLNIVGFTTIVGFSVFTIKYFSSTITQLHRYYNTVNACIHYVNWFNKRIMNELK